MSKQEEIRKLIDKLARKVDINRPCEHATVIPCHCDREGEYYMCADCGKRSPTPFGELEDTNDQEG